MAVASGVISRVAVIVAALGLASCILFVSPDEYGAHCGFEGEQSPCGSCVASRCREEMDACCRDDACAPTLRLVERCASGETEVCSRLPSEGSAAAPTRVALAACVAGGCKGSCQDAPANNITQCSVPTFGRGQTCSCIVSETPNDTACDETAFPNTACCAPDAWPGPSLRCSCRAFDCMPTSDGCMCRLTDGASTSAQCNGSICCLENDICSCGSRPCIEEAQKVPSCNFERIGCALGQKRVPSCATAR